uniref:Uncharacterized protein n=1 Tax=Sphaerodactylus townsendi TaxID=933632 RepID=A0ACB8FLA9_9SAUR
MESPPAQEKKPLKPLKRDAKQAEQKTDASKPKIVSLKTVITGGAGHFGFTLGCTLAKAGTDVVIYDIQKPLWPIPKGVALVQGDVRHYTDFYAACEGADCVVHAAAYGMSGVEQLHRREIQSVNVRGTGIVIEVCRKRNIPRLIYTSTVNVVFAGQTIIDGDEESVPYYPLDKHVNEYSRTKSIAEQMVLAANGSSLAGGGKLYTCALRAPGIYGPEEQRHMPRMAGGQAYFINDGEKVNLYEWLSPLFEALGARKPWIHSPVFLVHLSAVFMEYLYLLLRPLVEINPLVTRYEVHNISCMHTFKIDKARKQLGYAPKKYTFASCVDHFMKTRPRRRNFFLLKLFFCLLLFVGMIVLCVKYRETGDFLRERWARYQELLQ